MVTEHHFNKGVPIDVVVGFLVVVVVVGVDVVVDEEVEVVVRLREVMSVVVLLGDCPGCMVVVVLELVVVLFVLCTET
jgi:hypothetical protein